MFYCFSCLQNIFRSRTEQKQLAPYYTLHNQSVSISGPFLDLTQACIAQKAWKAKLTNTNLPWAAKSTYFVVIWKKFWNNIRNRDVAKFSSIAKAHEGRFNCESSRSSCRWYIVQAWFLTRSDIEAEVWRQTIPCVASPNLKYHSVRISLKAVAIIRGGGWAGHGSPRDLAGPLHGPVSFFLNFPFKFFWLTCTVDNQQYFKRYFRDPLV